MNTRRLLSLGLSTTKKQIAAENPKKAWLEISGKKIGEYTVIEPRRKKSFKEDGSV